MATSATKETKLVTFSRLGLGLIFVVFGLNGFLNFLPMPPPEGVMATFMGGLAATGYFFPLLKGTEVLVGVALLSGRFVPLALTVLAPITVNILALHLFVAPEGLPIALVVTALNVGLAIAYRQAYAGLLDSSGTRSSTQHAVRQSATAA